MLEPTYLSN